jgi:hypothetical protein
VIYIHPGRSPSTLEMFDWKPRLKQMHGQPCPDSCWAGERFAFIKGHRSCSDTPYRFERSARPRLVQRDRAAHRPHRRQGDVRALDVGPSSSTTRPRSS